MIGHIHSTESFGAADGPGVRFIVFMQGCHMRCRYCHNPDTWKMDGGDEVTADEILKRALRFKPYWGKDGGITISGGEPLLQIDFVIELFKKAKKNCRLNGNKIYCGLTGSTIELISMTSKFILRL